MRSCQGCDCLAAGSDEQQALILDAPVEVVGQASRMQELLDAIAHSWPAVVLKAL